MSVIMLPEKVDGIKYVPEISEPYLSLRGEFVEVNMSSGYRYGKFQGLTEGNKIVLQPHLAHKGVIRNDKIAGVYEWKEVPVFISHECVSEIALKSKKDLEDIIKVNEDKNYIDLPKSDKPNPNQ